MDGQNKSNQLKTVRNSLLKLHKILLDAERHSYEAAEGSLTSGAFLQLLLEDVRFAWLRKFSVLIVDIDEMFAANDGPPATTIEDHLTAAREIVNFTGTDETFNNRYQVALQTNKEAAILHSSIAALLN
jgi:hypothetical protein